MTTPNAPCRDNPEAFTPPHWSIPAAHDPFWRTGRDICHTCPLKAACLEWVTAPGDDPIPWSMAAGLTPQERYGLREGPRVNRKRGSQGCGTNAGYQAHHRAKERACGACTEARSAYRARLRAESAARREQVSA